MSRTVFSDVAHSSTSPLFSGCNHVCFYLSIHFMIDRQLSCCSDGCEMAVNIFVCVFLLNSAIVQIWSVSYQLMGLKPWFLAGATPLGGCETPNKRSLSVGSASLETGSYYPLLVLTSALYFLMYQDRNRTLGELVPPRTEPLGQSAMLSLSWGTVSPQVVCKDKSFLPWASSSGTLQQWEEKSPLEIHTPGERL